MTAPATPSVTRSVFGSSTTDHNVTMPASTAEGRLLVAFISTLTVTPILPDGWDAVDSDLNSLGRLSIYARETDGTEGGTTVNFETSSPVGMVAHVHYFNEPGYTIADCISAATGATGSSSAPDPPSRTTGWGSTDFITLAATSYYSGTLTAAPSGYSGLTTDSGGAYGLSTAYKSSTAASSENPGAFTASVNPVLWAANTVCVRLNPSPPAADPPTISDVDPDTFAWGEQIEISCADNGATKGSGKVEISDNATYASGTKVIQSSVSWVDGTIIVNTVQGAHGAGTHYVWITNDDGDRNSTGFAVTATEDEPTPPEPVHAAVLFGPLQVQIYGSPPVGMIDELLSASIQESVSELPSAAFSASPLSAGVDLAVGGAEVGIRRVGEGEIFRGFIEKRTVVTDEAGASVVQFGLVHLGLELRNKTTGRSVLVLDESVTSAATALLDGTGWSFTLTGSDFPNVTKEWINVSVLEALAELAEIAGGYWRVNPVAREFEIINTNPSTGITITNPGETDLTSARFGVIKQVNRDEEDVTAVVNRVGFEIKTDQARLITLQESSRSSPYTIHSEFLRSARYISHVAAVVTTGAFETVLSTLGENRYAVVGLHSDGITAASIARLGGQFMAFLELVTDDGGSGESIGHWGGVPQKGAPAVDIEVVVPGPTYAFAAAFEGVDQVSPIRESDTAKGTSTSPTITIDSAVGDLVFGVLWMRTAGDATITPAAGTELIAANTGAGTYAVSLWQKAGAATTTTMSWTINSSRSWAAFAVSLKPALRYYIEDSASQTTYDVREKNIPLPSFGQVEEDNEALANTGYDWLADYLAKHATAPRFVDIDLSYLPGSPLDWSPGDSMEVKHRSVSAPIDDDLIVTSRTQAFGPAGDREWALTLSNRAQFRRDEQGVWLMQQLISRLGAAHANQV